MERLLGDWSHVLDPVSVEADVAVVFWMTLSPAPGTFVVKYGMNKAQACVLKDIADEYGPPYFYDKFGKGLAIYCRRPWRALHDLLFDKTLAWLDIYEISPLHGSDERTATCIGLLNALKNRELSRAAGDSGDGEPIYYRYRGGEGEPAAFVD